MTDTDPLARIDAALESGEIDLSDAIRCQAMHITPSTGGVVRSLDSTLRALREARDVIVRLSVLIPEPPTDEPKCAHGIGLTDLCEHVERLVNAGPPTDDQREALEDVIRDCTSRGLTYEQAVKFIMASDPWRNRHTPLPADDEREALAREVYRSFYPGDVNTPDSMRSAESDAREFDRAYKTWDAGREGYAPGGACRRAADRIMASPVWRNRGRGPIADEERVREACNRALATRVSGSSEGDASMAALAAVILRILDGTEPAEAARDAEAGR